MRKDKASNSIINFRKEIEDILNTILANNRYQYTFLILKNKQKEFKIPDKVMDEFISPIENFEKRNFTFNYLFISVITILETYLKDRIVEELNNFPSKKKDLIKNYKIDRKLGVEDIIAGIDPIVEEIINGIIYHNFSKVSVLYKIVLKTKILEFIPKSLWRYVKIRHDLVHRSGNIDSKKIMILEFRLLGVMSDISKWAENIDYYCRKGVIKKKHTSIISMYEKCSKNYPNNEFFDKLMRQNLSRKAPAIDAKLDNEFHYI